MKGEGNDVRSSRQRARDPETTILNDPRKETGIMKETINVNDYAARIISAIPKGVLLNTNGDKFNAMVIGWGHLGTLWSRPTFHVYVRQGRYTKGQLDRTG